MSPRTKVTIALVAGVLGLVILAAAVMALVLGASIRTSSAEGEADYGREAKIAIALGIIGLVTSTTLTLWLLV